MRTMSATLQAAARACDREAYALARVSDQPCERPRLALAEVYAGDEGDAPHCAVVAADGSINRLRLEPGDWGIRAQRVTDIGDPAQWADWQTVSGHGAGDPPGLALCLDASAGRLWRFVVVGDQTQVHCAYSDDHGATWSDWANAWGSGGDPVGAVAASEREGEVWLAAAVAGGDGHYLAMTRRDGGAWPLVAETAHDHPAIDGIGMAVGATGDLYIVLAEGSPGRLAFQEFDPELSNWGAAGVILEPGAGSPVGYARPAYARLADLGRTLLTYVERSAAPAYERAVICFSPVRWWITEEVPWRFPTTYGVAVLRTAGDWLIVASDRAYRAPRYSGASGELLDITDERVVALESQLRAGQPGHLRLLLDNSGGWYDEAGVAGPAKCIRPGAQLGLKLGLWTAAGQEGVWQTPWWITRVGYEAGRRGEGYLVVEARDTRGELDALRARRQYQWRDLTLGAIVQRCWWRVCGRAESSPHGHMALAVPYFAVGAGERWGDAVARLCRMTGTLLRWHNAAATGVGWQAAYPEVIDLGGGAAVWAFGGDGQEVAQGSYWQGSPEAQRVEVFGSGCWGERRDWSAVWEQWRDVGRRVVDFKLDAPDEADDRAEWEWRQEGLAGAGGWLRVGAVPGLEVGDVVTVSEPRAGLAGAPRTVVELRTMLDRRRGIYEQEVELRGAG